MNRAMICKGCLIHPHIPIFIRGPLAIPFRLFGLRISRMNPNLCTLCETICETKFNIFKKIQHVVVPVTILFVDIRGYTTISQIMNSSKVASLLGSFYEICGSVIWERDGIINKLIGDEVFAIFNFPITRSDHVQQAVLSGVELQEKCIEMKSEFEKKEGEKITLGIGIGIHTGNVSIGEIGQFCKDFTAVGEVVNLASRLQDSARPGEVVLSEDVYRYVEAMFPKVECRICELKGISKPVCAYVLQVKNSLKICKI